MTTSEYQQKKEEILNAFKKDCIRKESRRAIAGLHLNIDKTSTAIDNLILELIGEDEPVMMMSKKGYAVGSFKNRIRNQLKASLRNIVKGSKE